MRLLLDECVTRYLKPDLSPHEVFTVDDAGFKGLKNGKLLRAVAGQFDVLVTVDKSLPHQQNIALLPFAILILSARSNSYDALKPLVPQALVALENIKPGEVVRIEDAP